MPRSERRRWQRLPLAIPVFVHGIDERGHKFVEFATAINISAGGAQLAIERYLPPSSRISLEIPCTLSHEKASSTRIKQNFAAKVLNKAQRDGVRFHILNLKFSRPLVTARAARANAAAAS